MSYKHKCVLYPAAYCTLKIETAFDHVYMRVNTQHVWKGVNPYPSLIHHSCVPNPCPRLEGTPCGTVFTDHCCSINSLKQGVSLQLEGRKWAWRAQGLAGVAAPGALCCPLQLGFLGMLKFRGGDQGAMNEWHCGGTRFRNSFAWCMPLSTGDLVNLISWYDRQLSNS